MNTRRDNRMDFDNWGPIYQQISVDLELDTEKDAEAGRFLAGIIRGCRKIRDREETLLEVQRIVEGKRVYVFGAGPDLEDEFSILLSEKQGKGTWVGGQAGDDVIIAADGASSYLLSNGFIPHIIVSDMDGCIEDQLACVSRGSILFLHAHGDNMNVLEGLATRLHGRIIGTTQTNPSDAGGLDNFGGFSDGDRAAFVAQHFGARQIILLGYNFNEVGEKMGSMGRRENLSEKERMIKFKKLAWASILLGVITRPQVRFYSEIAVFNAAS
ncbi:MAG: 6-hydroxymethylpterin diphosphokinase MptE-like protein [Thermoplasmatota archaeon]